MKQNARRCSARRKDGQLCRAWARRDSRLALCAAHVGAAHVGAAHNAAKGEAKDSPDNRAGFYASTYELEKIADLLCAALEGNLDDELSATRVAVLRLVHQMEGTVDREEYGRMLALLFRGVGAISGIMRTKHAVSQEEEESSELIAEVLREVGAEMGAEL